MKLEETGRNIKNKKKKTPKISRNWIILKETGINSTFCTFCTAEKMLSAPFTTPGETKISVLISASVERFGVYRMQDF